MKPKFKKVLIVISVTIITLVAGIILFISPITKYLVEKYDKEYSGREIEMDWAYVNPFTGYIYFSNLKFYESESDSTFFSISGLSVNIALLKLLSKTYEITKLTLDKPQAIIIQNKMVFNFDDLIKKFIPENSDTTKEPLHVNILNIKINNGEFHYREEAIPVNYFIKQVNVESNGMKWDVDTVAVTFSFFSGPGSGSIKGNSTINVKNKDYRFAVIANKFDLKILEQYLKAMSNYGSLRANLDADIQTVGNLNETENVSTKGSLAINDFHFGKDPENDYASFEKFTLSIKELSPKKPVYSYDSVSLRKLYFKYERYDSLDNLQNMFGRNGSNIAAAKADAQKFNLIIELADYIKIIAKNFFRSDYQVNRLAIYDADLHYNDFSISEKFSISLNPFTILADSIGRTRERVNMTLRSGIKPYGDISVDVSVNPKDSSDFEMRYQFEKMPSAMFNPYIISYTSFALDRGTIELNGTWNVKNGIIKSDNHLLVIDPRTTKRIRNKDTKWIPMPLIMSFIRERGDVIDYEIPIKGNLKDPKFKLHDVIMDLLKNIFINPPTTPYRIQVKNIETEIEKSLSLKWAMRQNALMPNQEKFVERMVDFLVANPAATIDVYPNKYAIKEKEYISFFEAKKKYFLLIHNKKSVSFNEDDSIKIDKMSVKDHSFVRYLDKQLNDTMLFTVQEKCRIFIGEDIIEAKLIQLYKEREGVFSFYFKIKNIDKRVKIHTGKNTIPYNGFSFYKINYKGAVPESLLNAYKKMNELDDEQPRKKYRRERRKNKNDLLLTGLIEKRVP